MRADAFSGRIPHVFSAAARGWRVSLATLRDWLVSSDGLAADALKLRRFAAAKSMAASALTQDADIADFEPDWRRVLLAASVLATSDQHQQLEIALMIAHAGLLFGSDELVKDASAVVLNQLANRRAVSLAFARHLLPEGLDNRLGISEQLQQRRREIEQTIIALLSI